jgi:hypothetical protein
LFRTDKVATRAMALKARIAAHACDKQSLMDAKKVLQSIATNTEADPRARVNAARFLLQHDWDVLEHDNPPVKSAQPVEHLFPAKITVEVVKAANAPANT